MFCQGRKEILGYSQNDPKLKTLLLNVDMVLTNEDLKEQDRTCDFVVFLPLMCSYFAISHRRTVRCVWSRSLLRPLTRWWCHRRGQWMAR